MARPRVKPTNYEEKSSEESSNNAENESEGSGEESTGGYVIPKKIDTQVTVPAPETKKTDIDPQAATKQSGKSPKKMQPLANVASPKKMQPLANVARVPTSKAQALQPVKSPPSKAPPSEAPSSKKQSAEGNAKSVATASIVNAKKRAQVSANKEESLAKKMKEANSLERLEESDDEESKQSNPLDRLDEIDEDDSKQENDGNDSLHDELSVDELIEKAETELLGVADYLYDHAWAPTDILPFVNVAKYKQKVVKLHEKNEEEANSNSPLWKSASSLEMLHGLHHVCLYISDVLYGEEKLSDSGVHPDTQMLATYICEFANWIWCLQNTFTHLY